MFGLPGNLQVLVTKTAAAQRDSFGDPVPAVAVVITVEGCLLAPGPSAETQNRSDTNSTDWTLYAPEEADIDATDTVTVPALGMAAEVLGDPQRWPGAGLVVALQRVTG